VVCISLGLAALLAVAWLRLPLVWVLLTLGGIGMGLAYRRLSP
jgi:hypothetical protein